MAINNTDLPFFHCVHWFVTHFSWLYLYGCTKLESLLIRRVQYGLLCMSRSSIPAVTWHIFIFSARLWWLTLSSTPGMVSLLLSAQLYIFFFLIHAHWIPKVKFILLLLHIIWMTLFYIGGIFLHFVKMGSIISRFLPENNLLSKSGIDN